MSSSYKNQISKLVTKVRKLHSKNEPLNLSAAKRRFPDLVEAAYAIKPFLGWQKLLMAAGIDYKDIEREYLDYVVCNICCNKFGILTGHLMVNHSMTTKEYRQKYPEAELMSETLRIKRSGKKLKPINTQTTLPHWEELWTPEYLLDRIEAYRERGRPLNYNAINNHDRLTTDAAIRFFGSWDAAMERIGISPDKYRQSAPGISLSPEEVIEGLKDRMQKGLPLNERSLVQSDLRLINAARRRFGSYVRALEAADIDPQTVYLRKQFSDDDFNKIIKTGHKINRLTGDARLNALKKLDKQYRAAIYSRYESWRTFATKLGFDPVKFSFYEQEEDLIIAIKNLPSNMTSSQLFKENRSLYCKISRRIGPVSKVLKKYHPVTHILRKGGKKTGAKRKKTPYKYNNT